MGVKSRLLFLGELGDNTRSYLLPSLDVYTQRAALVGKLPRLLDAHYVERESANDEKPIPCWDRLMVTYRDQPAKGHQKMIIGLNSFRDRTWQALPRILAMPSFKLAARGSRGGSIEGRRD